MQLFLPYFMQAITWSIQPETLLLSPNAVHIHLVSVDDFSSNMNQMYTLLSFDEQLRADCYAASDDRAVYIIVRSLLRRLLMQYLSVSSNDIVFHHNRHGKPSVANYSIEFNLSHTEGVILFVFAAHEPVGIDIEKIKSSRNYLGIAQRFFTDSEYLLLQNAPAREQLGLFYRLWTCKEAVIKAKGSSLSQSLKSVTVNDTRVQQVEDCVVQGFVPNEGYEAAVAVKGNPQAYSWFKVI